MRVGDRYEYDPEFDLLDKKGLGTVYRAVDTAENKVVALKCIPPDLLPTHYDLAQEIERVKYHSDEHLVRYYDVFEAELPVDVTAIPDNVLSETNIELDTKEDSNNNAQEETLLFHVVVMEYIEGKTLDQFPVYNLTEESLQYLLRDVLLGLHYLHDHRIIHRDLRQSKVLIQEQGGQLTPKILYFGLSTQLSQFMPDYGYLPPERLGKYDERISKMSDIWMFGVLVYELLTNQLPFGSTKDGTANDAIMINILSNTLQGELTHLIPPYREIVQNCLKNDPQDRYQEVDEVLALFTEKTVAPVFSTFETTKGFDEPSRSSLSTTQEDYEDEIYGAESVEQVAIQEPTPVTEKTTTPKTSKSQLEDEKAMFDTLDETTDFKAEKEKRMNRLLLVALILSIILTGFGVYFLMQYTSKGRGNNGSNSFNTGQSYKPVTSLYLND